MDVERKELSFKANPSMCGKRRTEESKTRRSAYIIQELPSVKIFSDYIDLTTEVHQLFFSILTPKDELIPII